MAATVSCQSQKDTSILSLLPSPLRFSGGHSQGTSKNCRQDPKMSGELYCILVYKNGLKSILGIVV